MNELDIIPAYLNPPAGASGKFANGVSKLINPVFVGIFIVGLLTFRAIDSPLQAIKWLSLTVLLTSLPTLAYVKYLVNTGYLVDIYMPDRKRRVKPMSVILLWLIISIIILMLVNAPKPIIFLINAVMMQVLLLFIVTLLWKISFHSATITTAATVTLLLGSDLTWAIIPMVPLVGWSRVYLHRHTRMQVIAGCVAGFGVAVTAFNLMTRYISF